MSEVSATDRLLPDGRVRSGGAGARLRSLWLRFALGATHRAEAAFLLTVGSLGLVLAAGVGGSFAPVNGRLFGLLALLTVVLASSRRRGLPRRAWALAAAGVALSLISSPPVVWLDGFAVTLAALAMGKGRARGHLLALSLGALISAVLLAAATGVPRLWLMGSRASIGATALFGALTGEPLRLGPSASGAWPLAVVGAVLASELFLRRSSAVRVLLSFLALGAAAVVFLVLIGRVPTGLHESAYQIFTRQWLAGLLAAPSLWIAAGARPRPLRERSPAVRYVAAGALALAMFGLAWAPPPAPVSGRRVLLLDEGFLDWKVPVYGEYGPFNVGLFGQLPSYLRLAGHQPRIQKGPVTPALLQATDLLVVINPQRAWSRPEMEAIWSFVRRGGGLLVVGDHTDLKETQASLNQLVGPAGVAFRFDSGFPAREAWWHCLRPLRHAAVLSIRASTDALISVGATLDVQAPAYPLVAGSYGFSDLGNRLNVQGAYLGDYAYQRGEQLGDVVLVAAARIGAGRVVVFGDTSSFQNAALAFTFEPFVAPLLRWLTDPGASHPRGGWTGLALLLAGLAAVALASGPRTAVLLGAALALGTGVSYRLAQPDPVRPIGGRIAWVDLSHNERVSLTSMQEDGVGSIMTTLSRSGYQPLVMRRFDANQVFRGKLFLTMAPTRAFEPGEVDALERFARAGGLIVAAAGWKDRHGSAPLLSRFGIELSPVPLGPVPVVREDPLLVSQKAMFVEAWAVEARPGPIGSQEEVTFVSASRPEPLPGLPADPFGSRDGAVQVFYQVEDFPLVLFRALGRGGLVAIGDSRFLGDGNLETLRYHRVGNILFVRDVLRLAEAWGG